MCEGDEGETDATTDRVACLTCEGTGQQLPVHGRPCVVCAGSGLVRAAVARDIADSDEMEAGPRDDG